jgi:hypothetical protein
MLLGIFYCGKRTLRKRSFAESHSGSTGRGKGRKAYYSKHSYEKEKKDERWQRDSNIGASQRAHGASSMAHKTLLLKVMFPRTSPIISKIFNIDSSMTVRRITAQIAEHVKSGFSIVNCGLYIPKHGIWLEDDQPLSKYADLIKTAVNFFVFVKGDRIASNSKREKKNQTK